MEVEKQKKSVVVIGGGTGTYTVLKGLKKYESSIDITAVISMTDSGGSTGRLRDQFGYLPVGDVRMALAALSRDVDNHDELLRELFLYRFEKGDGLKGHNFGNLLLTALTDILGSETYAVVAASRILRVQGNVIPVTTDDTHLVALYDDGEVVAGEHSIDNPAPDRKGKHIVKLSADPFGVIHEPAHTALLAADLIVVGPGDLYSSLIANFVIAGVPEALQQRSGKIVFISNLMERFGQTEGMTVDDCTKELCQYMSVCPDVVLVHNGILPKEVVKMYKEKEGTSPVVDDADVLTCEIVRADIADEAPYIQNDSDVVTRSLIRHDGKKLASVLMKLL